MKRTQRIVAGMALLAMLMTASQPLFALGLGNATVESYLGQPLNARIDLIVRQNDDLDSVSARLAAAEDFALIGASQEAIGVPLRFAIERIGDGGLIRVSSNLPVRDPVIRLIVEVNWSSGRMLREYTLFLDPPGFAAPAPAPVVSTRPAAAPAPARVEPAPVPSQPDTGNASQQEGGEYGPVQSGETLWRIAANWSQGSGLTVQQAMLAIQRNNPQAFINNNINLLRRGAVLRLPTAAEVADISPASARAEVSQQTVTFTRDTAARPAVETPLLDTAAAPLNTDATASEQPVQDQLEIVPPAADQAGLSTYGADESGQQAEAVIGTQALREELARTEEDLINQKQENEYLRDRIADLEGRLAATAEEGGVADADLAGMEQRLREERAAAAAREGDSDSADDDSPVETPVPEAQDTATLTSDIPQVSRVATAPASGAWYDRLPLWLIALAVLMAAVVGWLVSRRKAVARTTTNRQAADDTVRHIQDEAQEILQVLEPEIAAGTAGAGEAATAQQESPTAASGPGRQYYSEEAEVLDEDSADPEVRLDLARAYILMGDKEAARSVLDEVLEHGTEQQQSEARTMLQGL